MTKVNLKSLGLTAIILIAGTPLFSQSSQILNDLNTQTTTAAGLIRTFVATVSWIFLTVGIVVMIYSAIVDSQRLKFGVISFVAAALILTVGYGAGLL